MFLMYCLRYQMMLACWNELPEERPHFSQISQQMKAFMDIDTNADSADLKLLNDSVDVVGSTDYLEVIG